MTGQSLHRQSVFWSFPGFEIVINFSFILMFRKCSNLRAVNSWTKWLMKWHGSWIIIMLVSPLWPKSLLCFRFLMPFIAWILAPKLVFRIVAPPRLTCLQSKSSVLFELNLSSRHSVTAVTLPMAYLPRMEELWARFWFYWPISRLIHYHFYLYLPRCTCNEILLFARTCVGLFIYLCHILMLPIFSQHLPIRRFPDIAEMRKVLNGLMWPAELFWNLWRP